MCSRGITSPASSCCTTGTFSAASWTRFSPMWRKPARTAATMASAGCVFETPTSVISSARRPTRAAASSMLSRTRARFSAMLPPAWITRASGGDADQRGEAAGRLAVVRALPKEALRLAPRADAGHLDVLGWHADLDERLAIRRPQVELAVAEQVGPVAEGLSNVLADRVATRPDGGPDAGHDVARVRSEHLTQRPDGGARRAHGAAPPAGMHRADHPSPGVG